MREELFTIPFAVAPPASLAGSRTPESRAYIPPSLRELRENGNPPTDSFLDATPSRAEMTHYFRTPAVKQEVNAVPRLLPFTVLLSLRDTTRRSYRGRLLAPRGALVCKNCVKSLETLWMHSECPRFFSCYSDIKCCDILLNNRILYIKGKIVYTQIKLTKLLK